MWNQGEIVKNKYLKDKIIKIVWIVSVNLVLLLLFLFVYRITSKRYTMDFDVKVDNSQQLTVRLRGKEYDDRLSGYYGIDKIDIFNKGKKIQTIVLSEEIPEADREALLNGHTESWGKDGCFEAIDVNFDGAQDFSLMAEGYAGANIGYYYFTWNVEKQQYEYSFFLVRSGDIKIENEEIKVEVQAGAGPPYEITYGYDKDGTLQELVRIEREFWEKKYVKSFVYERIDGEMVFQGSEIEISIADGEELSREEYEKVEQWLQDNLAKGDVLGDQYYYYHYFPNKKISFNDKEFYYVSVRWGTDNEGAHVYNTSRVGELILTCDFTEEYSAWYKKDDKLIIYDYPEKNHMSNDVGNK